MPTIETVETHHDKAATVTCFVATVKNTQQSTSSGLMKKATKYRRSVLTETATGITATIMMVTATIMMVAVTIMTVTGMAVMAHISCLVLEDTS
eukprot:8502502-Ditylum_brightwellii.AAC.1